MSRIAEELSGLVFLVVVGGGILYAGAKGCDSFGEWRCRSNMQEDVTAAYGPEWDAQVDKCVGTADPVKATCFVRWLDGGKYTTHAMTGDCSRAHSVSGAGREANSAAFISAYREQR